MQDPLETDLVALLERHGIAYTRPLPLDPDNPSRLDFHLTDIDLYIELKQFYTPRISRQLSSVPNGKSTMVLMGRGSIAALERLVEAIAAQQQATPSIPASTPSNF